MTHVLQQLPAYRVGVMLWGGLGAIDVTHALAAPAVVQVTVVVLLVAGLSRHVPRPAALLVAGTGWLLVNGFVVDSFGLLAWHGAPDAARLGLLGGVAMLAGGRR
jgi:hypothetical protein